MNHSTKQPRGSQDAGNHRQITRIAAHGMGGNSVFWVVRADSRDTLVVILMGIEMDIPTRKALVHYIGATLIICAVALLIHVVRWW